MTIKASSPKKEGKGLTSVSHDLNRGQRVLVIGGPRKGQRGSVHDITDCMYELKIDNGEVGHVWKQNVETELAPRQPDRGEQLTEEETSLHYRLAKAIQKLKRASEEVENAHAALDIFVSSRQTKPKAKHTRG